MSGGEVTGEKLDIFMGSQNMFVVTKPDTFDQHFQPCLRCIMF